MAKKVKPGKLRGNTTPALLTPNPNDFVLQLIGGMKYSLADIVQLVLMDGVTTKSAQDIEESFRLVMEKGIEMSLMGNNVSLEYIQMRASVSGVFNSSTEPFTRPKHEVNPVLVAGESYLEAAHQTLVTNMGLAQNNVIAEVINRTTGNVNTDISSGGVLEVRGKGLKVGGSSSGVCVFILDAETDSVAKRVEVKDLLVNTPTQVMFQVPAGLEAGKTYKLKISTQIGTGHGGQELKDPRLIASDISLTCL